MYKYPIVDLHATWLVLNPIQGCPNRCKYCFLNGVQLTGVKPTELVTPTEAINLLKKSVLYDQQIPICIESQSDAFATPSNIQYVKELIRIMHENQIMNTKIFITKCKIPIDFIEYSRKQKIFDFLSFDPREFSIEMRKSHA